MQPRKLCVLPLNLPLGSFKQDDAERQGRGSNAERVEPDNPYQRNDTPQMLTDSVWFYCVTSTNIQLPYHSQQDDGLTNALILP